MSWKGIGANLTCFFTGLPGVVALSCFAIGPPLVVAQSPFSRPLAKRTNEAPTDKHHTHWQTFARQLQANALPQNGQRRRKKSRQDSNRSTSKLRPQTCISDIRIRSPATKFDVGAPQRNTCKSKSCKTLKTQGTCVTFASTSLRSSSTRAKRSSMPAIRSAMLDGAGGGSSAPAGGWPGGGPGIPAGGRQAAATASATGNC